MWITILSLCLLVMTIAWRRRVVRCDYLLNCLEETQTDSIHDQHCLIAEGNGFKEQIARLKAENAVLSTAGSDKDVQLKTVRAQLRHTLKQRVYSGEED